MFAEEKILIVDDESIIREMLSFQLRFYPCITAANGKEALEKLSEHSVSLVLTDIKMPIMNGLELLREVKSRLPLTGVIMISALADIKLAIEAMKNGADDYITKPFDSNNVKKSVEQSLGKHKILLEKQAQKVALEKKLTHESVNLMEESESATIVALAKLAEYRDPDSEGHLERVRRYTELLVKVLCKFPHFQGILSEEYIENVIKFSLLHDLGKIGIPDQILFKPGIFTLREFLLMQRHTLIGGDTLKVAEEKIRQRPFMSMAKEIAYFHHERFNGSGYPFGLKGVDIPLCARIVSLVDVYDAVTSRRFYKPAFEHEKAVEIIRKSSGENFDPEIVKIFLELEKQFEAIKNNL